MIVHDVQQGSPRWLQLRAGIPTSSEFDSIVTPGGQPSKSAERYLFGLLAERIMQHPRIQAVSTWMDRGAASEDEAVSFYQLQRDCETEKVGFITNDAGTIGASPDRLVGAEGLLEIKIPAEHTHVSYLLKKSVDQAYYPQIQGQLWIAERKWVDILSWHPEMPPALIRVVRDEEFIKLLSEAVGKFSLLLEEYSADLVKRGWIKPQEAPESPRAEFLSQADVDYAKSLAEAPQAESALAAPVVEEVPKPSPPPPAPKKRLTAFEVMLNALEDLKKMDTTEGHGIYYGVLGSEGLEHANKIEKLAVGRKIYQKVATALISHGLCKKLPNGELVPKSSGSVPPPTKVAQERTEPAPGSAPLGKVGTMTWRQQAAKMEQEAPPAELFPERPPPAPPPEDEWTRAMRHLYRDNPRLFLDKIAEWGLSKFEDIPQAQRQGRLEAMRVWLR